jgi:hypothetical protein
MQHFCQITIFDAGGCKRLRMRMANDGHAGGWDESAHLNTTLHLPLRAHRGAVFVISSFAETFIAQQRRV